MALFLAFTGCSSDGSGSSLDPADPVMSAAAAAASDAAMTAALGAMNSYGGTTAEGINTRALQSFISFTDDTDPTNIVDIDFLIDPDNGDVE